MFHLSTPGNLHTADSYTQAIRIDEVAPTSSITKTGGGSVTFEINSPANNWMIPKLSFFEFRLKVMDITTAASPHALNAADAKTGSVQFAEYPASHIVESYNHSINGASLETVSDCAELSAIKTRSMMSHDEAESYAASFRMRAPNGLPNKIDASEIPGLALCPFDAASDDGTTTFSCKYVPPGALWDYNGSLPGLRQRIVFTMTTNLKKAVISKDAAEVAKYEVTLESIKFFACYAIPETPIMPPRTVAIPLPMMGLSKQSAYATSQTLAFSVAPSTDKIYGCLNTDTPSGVIGTAAHEFKSDIQSIEFNYAGQTQPAISYGNALAKGHIERDISRAYIDYAITTGALILSSGIVDNETNWSNRPIFGAAFEKANNDSSTHLIVRVKASTAGQLVIAYRHHKVLVIRYGEDGLCEGIDVQERLSH